MVGLSRLYDLCVWTRDLGWIRNGSGDKEEPIGQEDWVMISRETPSVVLYLVTVWHRLVAAECLSESRVYSLNFAIYYTEISLHLYQIFVGI